MARGLVNEKQQEGQSKLMQVDVGEVALAIVAVVAAILVLMLLVLGLVRLSARRRQRFLGRETTAQPYRPVDPLDATTHDDDDDDETALPADAPKETGTND